MKWDNKTGYISYNNYLNTVKVYLGISGIDYNMRCELAPYITYILGYVSNRLILVGEGMDIKNYIQEIFDIFDYGSDKIISGGALDLAREIGITTDPTDEIVYDQDRFVFSWSNVLTALVMRIKYQYANLLTQPIITDCPCDCSRGQTTKDYENWTSGVYPEDENWEAGNVIVESWRITSSYPECTKCGRKI